MSNPPRRVIGWYVRVLRDGVIERESQFKDTEKQCNESWKTWLEWHKLYGNLDVERRPIYESD